MADTENKTYFVRESMLAARRAAVVNVRSEADRKSGDFAVRNSERQSGRVEILHDGRIFLHTDVHRLECATSGEIFTADAYETGV